MLGGCFQCDDSQIGSFVVWHNAFWFWFSLTENAANSSFLRGDIHKGDPVYHWVALSYCFAFGFCWLKTHYYMVFYTV